MKKITLYLTLLTFLTLAISCESDDKVVEGVLAGNTSGAVLRTLDSDGSFDMFRTENTFMVTLEEQDEDQGELIDRVLITIDFVDNNDDVATGDDAVSGVEFATIPGSDFTIGDRGLPTADFSFTMQEALTTMGIPLSEVLPGDRITINLELFFTDGRSFNAGDAATTVTGGSFFSSPFMYSLLVDDGIAFDVELDTTNEIDLSDGAINENYQVSISIDDASEGSLLQTLNVYRTLRDLTIGEDGTNLSQEESLFETFDISMLPLEDGARTLSLDYTLDQLLNGVTIMDLSVGDDIQLRYEIITADGRIVTTDENDTEYFFSIITSECVALDGDGPFPGEYTVNMVDSYGDGWNGGFLTVVIDGTATEFRVETGSEATGTFTIPEGAMTLDAFYTSLDWDDENSFDIIDPNGQKASVEGPFPNTNGQGPIVYPVRIQVCE